MQLESTEFDEVEVGYQDFIQYFGVDKDGEWLVLLSVTTTGVWIGKKLIDDRGDRISIIPNDTKSFLLSCPSGDPTKPVMSWPTTIGKIREVVAFYRAMDWSHGDALDPFQIAGFAARKLRSRPAKEPWPWGAYETELLRKLAAAADRFWKLYDPADVSTAPTNNAVADWLKEQGVADRNATVMATILRADNLPTGPRR